MKLIKFDLPIDGIKAKNIEELQEHFTVEILGHYHSGLLAKWLRSRNMNNELLAISSLEGLEEHALLKSLCNIFDVEVDDSIVDALLNESSGKSNKSTVDITEAYDRLAFSIDCLVFFALRTNQIIALETGNFNYAEADHFAQGDSLVSADKSIAFSPGAGDIYRKVFISSPSHIEKGKCLGLFTLSKYANAYTSDPIAYREFIIARFLILGELASDEDTPPLLQDALKRHIQLLINISEKIRLSRVENKNFLELIKDLPSDELYLMDLSDN